MFTVFTLNSASVICTTFSRHMSEVSAVSWQVCIIAQGIINNLYFSIGVDLRGEEV